MSTPNGVMMPTGPTRFHASLEPPAGSSALTDSLTVDLPDEIEVAAEGEPDEHDQMIMAGFYANLAEHLDPVVLTSIGAECLSAVDADESARQDWMKTNKDVIKYLGLTYEKRSLPFDGASGVTHPILLESVIRFQSEVMPEVFPSSGPCKTAIYGDLSDQIQDQAQRVEQHANYWFVEEMPDYRTEKEHQMWGLGLTGSAFSKLFKDPRTGYPVMEYVKAEDFLFPIGYPTLAKCPRYTHLMRKSPSEMHRLMASGFYRRMDFVTGPGDYDEVEQEEQRTIGVEPAIGDESNQVELAECHIDLMIEGLPEFKATQGAFPLPYVVTVDRKSGNVYSIYRNWRDGDVDYKRRECFVDYSFVLGPFGLYGIGLSHVLYGITRTATGLMRSLMDQGTFATISGGFVSKDLRIDPKDYAVQPGQWTPVDAEPGEMQQAFFTPPYQPPSPVLLQLLGTVEDMGRRAAANADVNVDDVSANTPTGTTLALLERGMKTLTAIQQRVLASQRRELHILQQLLQETLEAEEKEFLLLNRTIKVKSSDYDQKRIKLVPASDSDASTMSQRILQMQTLGMLSAQMPGVFDQKELARRTAQSLGVRDVQYLVPPDEDVPYLDIVTENQRLLTGQPVKAYQLQDHQSHIIGHMAAMQNPQLQQIEQNDPQAPAKQAATMAHIAEHLAFEARAQVEQALGFAIPQNLTPEQERQISPMLAAAYQKLLAQAQAQMQQQQGGDQGGQQQPDPVVQQQQFENQLKMQEMQQKGALKTAELAQKDRQFQQKQALEQQRIAQQGQIAEQNLQLRGNKLG